MRNVFVNVFKSECSVLAGSDLPHLLIDVRQNAASVKAPGLYDEPLEESKFSGGSQQLVDCHHAPSRYVFRFHRPSLHEDLRVHVGECVDLLPCVSRIPELLSRPCTEQSSQGEQLHILLHWSLVAIPRKLHQPVPSTRTHRNSKQTMFCFLEEAYTGYHVFSTEPLTQTAIPEQL